MNEKDRDQKSWETEPSTDPSAFAREKTTEELVNETRISEAEAVVGSVKDSQTVSEFIVSECGHVGQSSLLYKQVDGIVTLPKQPPRPQNASTGNLIYRWLAKPRVAAGVGAFVILAVIFLFALSGYESTDPPLSVRDQTLAARNKPDANDQTGRVESISDVQPLIVPMQQTEAAKVRPETDKAGDKGKTRDVLNSKDIPLLLAVADAHLRAVRLTRPKGNNAFEIYKRILDLEPENQPARQGLARIQQRYWELAERVAAKGQFKKAKDFLKSALKVSPASKDIQQAIIRLDERELNREKAQQLIALAQKFVDNGKYLEARREIDNAAQLLPDASDIAATREEGLTNLSTELSVVTLNELEKEQNYSDLRNAGAMIRDPLAGSGFGPEMVIIPPGSFQMGDLHGRGDVDEKPVRQVNVPKPFALGRYEVTFEEYDRFARASGRPMPDDNGWGRGRQPVVNITWRDAMAYTEWLSRETKKVYRLPSEMEWEYAARAGSMTRYWWGNQASHDYANYGKNICCDGVVAGKDAWAYTAPVGSFPPNQFGLFEVLGNVWEWTGSIYKNSLAETESSIAPQDSNAARVARGGAWNLVPKAIRSAYRSGFAPEYLNNSHGFRVARDVD